jgi:hypothetical protein
MKKLLGLAVLALSCVSFAQTHKIPALDTTNVFTGSNQFNGSFSIGAACVNNGEVYTWNGSSWYCHIPSGGAGSVDTTLTYTFTAKEVFNAGVCDLKGAPDLKQCYLATGDGATNDATAINAALVSQSATGGVITVPEGTFIVNADKLLAQSTVTLRGRGPNSYIKFTGTAPTFTCGTASSDTLGICIAGKTNVVFENLTLDFSSSTAHTSIMQDSASSKLTLRNVIIKGQATDTSSGPSGYVWLQGNYNELAGSSFDTIQAVLLQGVSDCNVHDNYFYNYRTGVYLKGVTSPSQRNCTVVNNHFPSVGGSGAAVGFDAVLVEFSQGFQIKGNNIAANREHGIYVSPDSNDYTVDGNYIAGCLLNGCIQLRGNQGGAGTSWNQNVTLSNNTIRGTGTSGEIGYLLQGIRGINATNNSAFGMGSHGFYINNILGGSFVGNRAFDNQNDGFAITDDVGPNKDLTFDANTAWANNRSAGTYAGFHVGLNNGFASNRLKFINNSASDYQSVPTQAYGYRLDAVTAGSTISDVTLDLNNGTGNTASLYSTVAAPTGYTNLFVADVTTGQYQVYSTGGIKVAPTQNTVATPTSTFGNASTTAGTYGMTINCGSTDPTTLCWNTQFNGLSALRAFGDRLAIGSAGYGYNLQFAGATSGAITIATPAVAGSNTLTWPARTATIATTTGATTTNDCAKFDASGNLVDAGACAGGSISGLTTNAIVAAASSTSVATPSATTTLDGSGNAAFAGTVTTTKVTTTNANGGMDGTEGTGAGLTAATGHDLLYPDSTAHRWKMNNNNGGAVQVVGSGADINASDVVVKVNGGSLPASAGIVGTNGSSQIVTSTGLSIDAMKTCADTSASSTAQVCNTSPTFTPAANSCIIYTTTTANTGAGLTLNVNSLGAKSVAKWQGSTTLTAGDVPANKPVVACYDGTNWGLSTIGNSPSGGSAFSNGSGSGYQDVTEIAAPANPGAGVDRLYTNSTTHVLACLTSAGADCMPSTGTVKNITIDSQGPTGSISANATDQTIYTTTIAANTLQANDMVRVEMSFKKTGTAQACTYKGWFGATSWNDFSTSSSAGDYVSGFTVFVNSTSSQSVHSLLGVGASGSNITQYSASPTESTTGTIVVKITENCTASADTLQGYFWLVERKRP